MSPRKVLATYLTAAAMLALAPAAASADFSVTNFTLTPSTTQAGAHPNVTSVLSFGGSDTVRNLTMSLPAGLVGNPQAAPKCAVSDFRSDGCSSNSQVGTVSVKATADGLLSLTISGSVYLLPPQGSEPVDLGIVVRPGIADKMYLVAPITLRIPGDAGLNATIADIPNNVILLGTASIQLNQMTLVLDGSVAGGNAFMSNPTSCQAESASVTASGYGSSPAVTRATAFQATGCASVPFTPALATTLSPAARDTPTALTAALTLATAGQSAVKNVSIALPNGVALNTGVASAGLTGCTDAQLDTASAAAASCPQSSKIGTATFVTPLLAPINGTVFIAQPTAQNPYRIFLDLPAPGADVKIVGDVGVDPQTGQVTTTFTGLPQIPLSSFQLSFRGGDQAVFTAPQQCGSYTTTGSLTPWSGTAPVAVSSAVTVSEDGQGAACPNPIPFNPRFGATVSSTQAGAATGLTLALARADRDARPSSIQITLPPGLSARLAGIPACPRAQVAANACDASTQLGSVQAQVGEGGGLLNITGGIYMTTPDPGHVAAIAIDLPANVGPFDLGTAATVADVSVNPSNGAISETAQLPTIIGGIPLSLRGLSLQLNRPGFVVNATACGAEQFAATVTATDGRTVALTAPYQATGCAQLPFAPQAQATITRDSADGGGGLQTIITQPAGQANLAGAIITLPTSVAVNPLAAANACPSTTPAPACPAKAVVGEATASTPLLPTPLSGPVVLFSTQTGFQLYIELGGQLSLPLLANVGLGNAVTTTLANIPDVPVTRFELDINGGPQSMVLPSKTACTAPGRLLAQLTAHNGAQADLSVTPTVTPCGGVAGATASGKLTAKLTGARTSHAHLTLTLREATKMTAARFVLPPQVTLAGAALTVHANGRTDRALERSQHTLLVKAPKGATVFTVSVSAPALRIAHTLPRKLTFSAHVTLSGSHSATVTDRINA
jgi:hypothetical protein